MMTQLKSVHVHRAAIAAAILLGAAASAHAQLPKDSMAGEPWRAPSYTPPTPHVTSSLDATKPPAPDQRQVRTLATALFAKPAAAQRAADKAAAAGEPSIPPAPPKAEWLQDDGLHHGGDGLEVSAPF